MTETVPRSARSSQEAGSHSRFVVINGDDFGFSSGVNQAIITAHRKGLLSSASLMITGAAFDEAVDLARQNPGLAVGLHLVTVRGKCALPARQVPHLVDCMGRFRDEPVKAGLSYQFSKAARRELALEIRTQLELFRQTGLELSHVDGHLHMHVHPVIMRILVGLAREFSIRTIRLPRMDLRSELKIDRSRLVSKALWCWIFGRLGDYEGKMLRRAGISFTDRVYGLLSSGEITEDYLLQLIPKMEGNLIEFYCHPSLDACGDELNGPPGSGPEELKALLSDAVREMFARHNFEVTNFNGVADCLAE
jgi:hopanoid biosynthesis associated protein HpnK